MPRTCSESAYRPTACRSIRMRGTTPNAASRSCCTAPARAASSKPMPTAPTRICAYRICARRPRSLRARLRTCYRSRATVRSLLRLRLARGSACIELRARCTSHVIDSSTAPSPPPSPARGEGARTRCDSHPSGSESGLERSPQRQLDIARCSLLGGTPNLSPHPLARERERARGATRIPVKGESGLEQPPQRHLDIAPCSLLGNTTIIPLSPCGRGRG